MQCYRSLRLRFLVLYQSISLGFPIIRQSILVAPIINTGHLRAWFYMLAIAVFGCYRLCLWWRRGGIAPPVLPAFQSTSTTNTFDVASPHPSSEASVLLLSISGELSALLMVGVAAGSAYYIVNSIYSSLNGLTSNTNLL